MHRHLTPPLFWKLQQLLKIGNEKKLSNAWKILDQFIYKFLVQEQKEFGNMNYELEDENFKILSTLRRDYKGHSHISGDPNKILGDTLLNLMAGRDSTSSALTWLFHLLAKNPVVEAKILDELRHNLRWKPAGNGKILM